MRRASAGLPAVLLLFTLSAAGLFPFGPPGAAADPWTVVNGDGTSDAVWNFTNVPDYALAGTEISGGVVTLRRQVEWWNSTTSADFAGPDSETNIDRTRWPGSVALAATSGPSTLLSLQPGASGIDAWLDRNNANQNHGADTTIVLDGRNPQSRPVLWFDLSGLPGGVVIDDATLNLYQSAGIGVSFTGSVHPVTAVWVESQVTWNNRLTGTVWATAGGDYNPHAVDARPIDNALGWRSWNVTPLVDLWYRARIPNNGLILVASNPGSDSDKTFYSSDYNVDPARRPRLDMRYRALGATGEYISKIGGPGTASNWRDISWNATTRSLVSDEFGGPALDPKWTWTNPPPTYDVGASVSGHLHIVSGTFVDVAGAVFTGHVLADGVVGDFTASLKMTSNPTAAGQKAGLMVFLNPRDWYAAQKTFVNPGASVNWRSVATADAASTVRADVVTGNPNPAWLQIVRVGNAFITYTSADGVAWTLLDAYTPAFEYPLAVRLAVLAADGSSGVPHTVDVDFLRVTHGTDATVSVQTRIGNTNPVDGTWSGWSAPYGSPSGSPMAGATSFVEFRLALAVSNPDHSPVVGDLTLSWSRFASAGTLETADLVPSDLAVWWDFNVVQALNGATITYAHSTDSGGSWTPVGPPASLQSVSTAPGKIRFRATFGTGNTLVSPTLSEMRLSYGHRLDHFHVTASAAAVAGTPFSVTVSAKDAANATLVTWTGAVTLEARLLDGVTPGGGVLGTMSLTISVGGTATLATETYTRAETIRILSTSGAIAGLSEAIDVAPGAVARIAVTPGSATLLYLDAQVFSGQAYDAYDNPIPGVGFDWTVVGGLGSLNATTGPSVTFTANPADANGTLEARSGAVMGSASIQVTSGTRPWITISAPTSGDHVTGTIPVAYANSADAISVRFEYDGGAGWTLIGSTAILNGTYLWDTSALDFAGGRMRAVVANARSVTNVTVVSPLDVDNTPPAVAITAVTDDQGTSGTLTVAYAVAADTVQVDLSYSDGVWSAIGSDPTIDGTFVWTPGSAINGVVLRVSATDEVGLTGMADRPGVGNRTVGTNPPRITTIPEVRVRVGSPYRLNLTFYISDADTPRASLTVSASDPTNVTASAGTYPELRIAYGSAGTYLVTLWVSDGTDTAWSIVRIVAGAGIPPATVLGMPDLAFDEDTAVFDAFNAPLTLYFADGDGEPLTFVVLDAFYLALAVNTDATLDLTAPADWFGSERLRVRATDPTGAWAEASFTVVFRPINDAPVIVPIPDLIVAAGERYTLDLRDYVTDADNGLATLTASTDSPYVLLDGLNLILAYPAGWDRAEFNITVFDGAAYSTQRVRVSFTPVWWPPILLALPSAGVIAVAALFAQRARWRPAKAFLVDEYGQLIREFTLDAACQITYEQVVEAGALEAQEKPIKVARYHAQTVAGDALAVVLLAVGPVTPDQIEFAREMLVNIQDKFDVRLKERLEETRALETEVQEIQRWIAQDRAAAEAKSRALAGVMDAVTTAQGKMSEGARTWRAQALDLEAREARMRSDREDVDRLAKDLGDLRESLEKRSKAVHDLEVETASKSEAVKAGEERVAPLEASMKQREQTVADKERELASLGETLAAKEGELERRLPVVQEGEQRIQEMQKDFDAKTKEADGVRAFLDARAAELQAQETEVANRTTSVKAREEHLPPLEAELAKRERLISDREAAARTEREAAVAKADQADRALNDTTNLADRVAEERAALETRAQELDERARVLEARHADATRLEAEASQRTSEMKELAARVTPIEAGLAGREAALAEKERELAHRGQALESKGDELGRRAAALREAEDRNQQIRGEIERGTNELDAARAEVERKSKELGVLETSLGTRLKEVEAREARLGPSERELHDFERTLAEREAQIGARSEDLTAKEHDLEARSQSVAGGQAQLAEERKGLETRVRESESQRARLATRWNEVEARAVETAARGKELDARESELAAVLKNLDAREASLASLTEAQRGREVQIVEKEKSIGDRMKKIELLEVATAREHAALARDREAFQAAKKEYETRTAGFSEEMNRRTAELANRSAVLDEQVQKYATDRERFEAERAEHGQWITAKDIELETREQSVLQKETAVRTQAEDNARRLAELSAREESVEIGTDRLERATVELDARKVELDRLAKSLEAKGTELREEEARKAEELRSWHSTLESEQAMLREQKETFERDVGTQREMWADRMLRVQMKEQEVAERETKVTSDVEWVAKNDLEVTRREKAASDALRETQELRSQLEGIRANLESRSMEVESRERTLREEAARHTDELSKRASALAADQASLAESRMAFEREASSRTQQLQQTDAELARRASDLDEKGTELGELEARLASNLKTLKELEDRLRRERADLDVLVQQLDARQGDTDRLQVRNDEEAARLLVERDEFRQATSAREAELQSQRERITRDSSALQEKLGAKAQELAAKGRDLENRERRVHETEGDIEKRLRELESGERQVTALSTDLQARSASLAKRQQETDGRAAQIEATSKKLAAEEAEKRQEWESIQKNLRSLQTQVDSDAQTRFTEISRQMKELEGRERALTSGMAQLEIERARLEDATKTQAAKDAEVAAASQRAEKRLAQVNVLEAELLRERQALDKDRAAWATRRTEELKQLEATRDAAGEQSAQAEKLIQEAQRRANSAGDSEQAAKRQAEELVVLQSVLEKRRAEAEEAQRGLRTQMSHSDEAYRKLAARERELTDRAKEVQEREARAVAAAAQNASAADEVRRRQSAVEREAVQLAKQKSELEAQRAALEAKLVSADVKIAEASDRERVITMELQRADNLMEDLGRKEAELKARQKTSESQAADLAKQGRILAQKETGLGQGILALDRVRQEIESRLAAAEEDRRAAASSHAEAAEMKDEATKAKDQASTMQKEVSKNMKFLQKKAVDVLDREEQLREREAMIRGSESALEARSEIVQRKDQSLQADRDRLLEQIDRLQAETARLKAKLEEAKKAAEPGEDMEAWKDEIEMRVKIIQKKAFDLLDREEKLRKREEELRSRAQELGVVL